MGLQNSKKIVVVNPKDFYDTECILDHYNGNQNKLDKDYIDDLVKLGREGLLKHIYEREKKITCQHYNNELIAIDGNHAIYAAFLLGIDSIPAVENQVVDSELGARLIPISDWDLLPKAKYQSYLNSLEKDSENYMPELDAFLKSLFQGP